MLKLSVTVGVNELLKTNQAYWLSNVIWSYLPRLKKEQETFAIALLDVKDEEATFTLCRDMEDNKPEGIYAQQHIPFTDYPKQGISTFYVGLADTNTYIMMLPEEY